MSTSYRSISALMISVMLVVMGQGVLNTIVPLAAKTNGYSEIEIGLLSSAYFVGMLLGAVVNPAAVRHAGHVRAFTASIAISTIAALTYTFAPNAWFWILLRGLGGLAIAGLYATVESWLQGKSDNSSRGMVLAVYSIVQYLAWASGNVLLQFAKPTDFLLFAAAAVCFCAGIIPMTVTEQDPPERPANITLPFVWLFRTCPLGVIGVFLVGLNNGPMWSLLPVYGADVGLTSADVGTMMVMLTLGSAASQLPIGRLSDKLNRLVVAVALLLATSLVELTLWKYGALLPKPALFAMACSLGVVVSPQYYIFVAYTNDRTGPARAVGIAAVMLFSYCVGAIIGPNTASAMMIWLGPSALHLHDSLVHGTLAIVVAASLLLAHRSQAAASRADFGKI